VLSCLWLFACAACALVSGVDDLQRVACVGACADASGPWDGQDSSSGITETGDGDQSTNVSDSASAVELDALADASPLDAPLAPESGIDDQASAAPDVGPGSNAMDVSSEGADSLSPPTIARVQASAGAWVFSASMTLTIDERAGDLLVAAVYFNQSTATVTVADSLGNAWKPTAARANTAACATGGVGGDGSVAQILYAQGVAAGHNVVRVTQSTGTRPLGAFLVEYSGVRAAGALDGMNGGAAVSSSPTMSAGQLTTTGTSDLVVALFVEATTSGVITPGPGFATAANDSTFYSMFEDNLRQGYAVMGPGTVVPTATEPSNTPSACWAATAAAFQAAR